MLNASGMNSFDHQAIHFSVILTFKVLGCNKFTQKTTMTYYNFVSFSAVSTEVNSIVLYSIGYTNSIILG